MTNPYSMSVDPRTLEPGSRVRSMVTDAVWEIIDPGGYGTAPTGMCIEAGSGYHPVGTVNPLKTDNRWTLLPGGASREQPPEGSDGWW